MYGTYEMIETNKPRRTDACAYEPILVRLVKSIHWRYVPITPVRFKPVLFRPIHCTKPMVYGVNDGSPRVRMRRQVQLGQGAPAWRGQMPTDRYQPIGPAEPIRPVRRPRRYATAPPRAR